MTMKLKYFRAQLRTKDLPPDAPEGSIQAMFSVFNVIDGSQEVVMPSFFVDGQEVAMSAWGHNWGSLPVGKGVIRVTPDGAVFDGNFFLNTDAGKQHYETVKAMGNLQEWSFGFRVLDARPGEFDGQEVWFLLRGETYEVSPVLVGDNRETFTIDLKALHADERLVFNAETRSYQIIPFKAGGIAEYEARFKDDAKKKPEGKLGIDIGLGIIKTFVTEAKAADDAETKEGRAISEARRNRIAEIRDELRKSADDLHVILRETEPKGSDTDQDAQVASDEVLASLIQFERNRSLSLGIEVPV